MRKMKQNNKTITRERKIEKGREEEREKIENDKRLATCDMEDKQNSTWINLISTTKWDNYIDTKQLPHKMKPDKNNREVAERYNKEITQKNQELFIWEQSWSTP